MRLSKAQVTSDDEAVVSPLNKKCVSEKEITDTIPERVEEEEVPSDNSEDTLENPIVISDDWQV